MVPMYISILSHLEFHYTFRIQILIFKINSDQSVVSAKGAARTCCLFIYKLFYYILIFIVFTLILFVL